MAAMIGIKGYKLLSATKAKSYHTYSRAFAMYAVMMTCSGFVHTIVPISTNAWFNFVVTYLDMVLTSSIAFHFGLAALSDIGVDENGKVSKALLFVGEQLIFGLWFYFGWLRPTTNAFWYLYVGVIVVCCGFWVLTQLVLMIRNKMAGFTWFALAAFAGGAGLWAELNQSLFCRLFGPNFGASFWWDALSNMAMVCITGYFFASREIPTPAPTEEQVEQDVEHGLEYEQEANEDLPPAYQVAASKAAHPQIVYIPLQAYPTPNEQ